MTVKDLIDFLSTQPQDLDVVYQICSEQKLLEVGEIKIGDLCLPRPDGWVHDKRPDKPFKAYLILPGN